MAATGTQYPGGGLAKGRTGGNRDGFLKEILTNRYLYIMMLPGLLFYLIFAYFPMIGAYIAFTEFTPSKGIFGSPFVGLRNFEALVTSPDILQVIFNTLFLNALFISTGLFMQITLAIMVSELPGRIYKKVTQSVMLFPAFMSWTVVAMIAMVFLSTDEGIFNSLISAFGGTPINFTVEAGYWPLILVILRMWKGVGFGTVIYLATITGIDSEIFEAAKIDGASRLQCIFRITIPMLKDTTIMLLLLAVGGIFYGDFGMIYSLIGDNPMLYPTTDVIDTFVFRMMRVYNDMGMSSATGLLQSTLGLVMVLVTNGITRKYSRESALF